MSRSWFFKCCSLVALSLALQRRLRRLGLILFNIPNYVSILNSVRKFGTRCFFCTNPCRVTFGYSSSLMRLWSLSVYHYAMKFNRYFAKLAHNQTVTTLLRAKLLIQRIQSLAYCFICLSNMELRDCHFDPRFQFVVSTRLYQCPHQSCPRATHKTSNFEQTIKKLHVKKNRINSPTFS